MSSRYSRDYFKEELKKFYFDDWIQESKDKAENYVYKGLKEREEIPDSYISQCIVLAQKQITLGGYRLANVLNELYGSNAAVGDEVLFNFFHQYEE